MSDLIQGSTITLRRWLDGDYTYLVTYGNNSRLYNGIFPLDTPITRRKASDVIERFTMDSSLESFAVMKDDDVIGGVTSRLVGEKDKVKKVTYWCDKTYFEEVIEETLTLFTDYVFYHSDVIRLELCVLKERPFLEQVGFEKEAILKSRGDGADEIMYRMLR